MKIETAIQQTSIGEVKIFTLTNDNGAQAVVSALGAGIVAVKVPDKEGRLADVVIGYDRAEDYIADGPCAGKTPGRYANRIAAGRFSLDGMTYKLPINNDPNHLHGGPEGYQNRVWNSAVEGESKVVFTLHSPDGDAGYPGNLDAKVAYTWTNDNTLDIDMEAVADASTMVNLTNHSYFNLGGHETGADRALAQQLTLRCSRWLPTDETLIPLGEIAPVAGTPMDFTGGKAVGRDIREDFEALRFGKGYDNCWMVDGFDGSLREAAILRDPMSGRRLTVSTDQPAAQVYSGNWLEGCPQGKGGVTYHDYAGVAIECQGCPDAPNHPNFPSQLLNPGETYRRKIRFAFSVE